MDPKLAKLQGGKLSYFDLIVRNKWRKGAKEAINGVFDKALKLETSFTKIIK